MGLTSKSWKKKGILNRKCIICKGDFKVNSFRKHTRAGRTKEEKVRPFGSLTCSKKCSKLKLNIVNNVKQYYQKQQDEKVEQLKENLIGLFDVYEIKIVNEGNEMTLREHEKKRMIRSEVDKVFACQDK